MTRRLGGIFANANPDSGCCCAFLPLLRCRSSAQRDPVLKQIDLPHPYYYREMYLPQLTTGPSAAAWAPDSPVAGVFDGGIAVAAEARLDGG